MRRCPAAANAWSLGGMFPTRAVIIERRAWGRASGALNDRELDSIFSRKHSYS